MAWITFEQIMINGVIAIDEYGNVFVNRVFDCKRSASLS